MRFAKKLALSMLSSSEKAPYISHHEWSHILCQMIHSKKSGDQLRLQIFDEKLRTIMINDLDVLIKFTKKILSCIESDLSHYELECRLSGLFTKGPVSNLSSTLSNLLSSPSYPLLTMQSGDCMIQLNESLKRLMVVAIKDFNQLINRLNHHLQWLEVNIAGFRKSLKQKEKLILTLPTALTYHVLAKPCKDVVAKVNKVHGDLRSVIVEVGLVSELSDIPAMGVETLLALSTAEVESVQTISKTLESSCFDDANMSTVSSLRNFQELCAHLH